MKTLLTTAAAVALVAGSAQSAVIYSQDFQSFAASAANPDSWTGTVRAFNGGASTEDGSQDTALISNSGANFTDSIKVLGAVTANTDYTLDVQLGFYSSSAGATGAFTYELGSWDGATFTAFSTATVENLTQVATGDKFFGNGNGIAGTGYAFSTGASVSGDVAIRISGTGGSYAGFDNIVVDATTAAVPEPSSTALLGLGGLALIMRRRK